MVLVVCARIPFMCARRINLCLGQTTIINIRRFCRTGSFERDVCFPSSILHRYGSDELMHYSRTFNESLAQIIKNWTQLETSFGAIARLMSKSRSVHLHLC